MASTKSTVSRDSRHNAGVRAELEQSALDRLLEEALGDLGAHGWTPLTSLDAPNAARTG